SRTPSDSTKPRKTPADLGAIPRPWSLLGDPKPQERGTTRSMPRPARLLPPHAEFRCSTVSASPSEESHGDHPTGTCGWPVLTGPLADRVALIWQTVSRHRQAGSTPR
ncbi:MAG: hypothetical protein ACRDN0_14570, partial [Trebonia sp.]